MPKGIDGQEVIRQVQAQFPHIPLETFVYSPMGKDGGRLNLKLGGRSPQVAKCYSGDARTLAEKAIDRLPRMAVFERFSASC